MRTVSGWSLRFALLLMATTVPVLFVPLQAQEPDDPPPEPEPWSEASDGAEDSDAMEEPGVGFVNDEVLDDEDDWWSDVPFDESDDAIPADDELDSTGEGWEVIAFEDDGDGVEDVDPVPADGIHKSGDIPVVKPRPRQGTSGGGRDTPYSIGGKPIRDAGAPWQAQIFFPRRHRDWEQELQQGIPLWQKQHFCGGTLIADDWVLTAAHCIDDDMVRSGYRIRLGAEDISKDEGMVFRIDRIVRHSGFAERMHPDPPAAPFPPPNFYSNDIALVHIVDDGPRRTRNPNQIRPIPLYQGAVPPSGIQVTGSGWGKTQDVEQHAPNAVLLKVDLQVMDTKTCQKLPHYGPERINSTVICAARKGRSTCRGDSGGPLILTNGTPQLVGIVSWGKERCNGDGQPAVYTSVVAHTDWIRKAMTLDASKSTLP